MRLSKLFEVLALCGIARPGGLGDQLLGAVLERQAAPFERRTEERRRLGLGNGSVRLVNRRARGSSRPWPGLWSEVTACRCLVLQIFRIPFSPRGRPPTGLRDVHSRPAD